MEELRAFCVTPVQDSRKLTSSFLQLSPHLSFLAAGFALYPLAQINHSHEYDNTLSPMSPSESWDLGKRGMEAEGV